MNRIAKEIESYLGSASMTDEEFLQHYGMPRRSGRYPWGSGDEPYQHGDDFISRIEKLKKSGWTETPENIKKEFDMSTTEYRKEKRICSQARRMYKVATAKSLEKDGLSRSEIGRKMGVNESTVRSWLNEDSEIRMTKAKETAEFLKKEIETKRILDVGADVERELNITRNKLDTALKILEHEGYKVDSCRVPYPTNKNQSVTIKTLRAPDVDLKEIYSYDQIKNVKEYISRDGGETYQKKFTYPSSMDSKRMMVRYDEDGGTEKDGLVELRRGLDDLSLNGSKYSQVRILVDGTHYIKGMAVYSDNLPDGVDLVFNTNKKRADCPNKHDVLKEIKKDPDNPFGSAIKDADKGGQYWYTDQKTGEKKLGLINKRADEGDWTEWADKLPSQFLSKQSLPLAEKQLNLAKANKADELASIMELENPTIKRYYLNKFASSCDGAAADLKAAALPGQKYHVIIPINTMKDNEIYAPGYAEGTKLALVRYPHGGTFEIPVLTVNNKNPLAKKYIGPSSIDAVGINKKIADQLSGADFDGDTVMCIPTHDRKGKIKIAHRDQLEGLKDFDPKDKYKYTHADYDENGELVYYRGSKSFKPMLKTQTNKEMGVISNLISDMTLAGAPDDEVAAAVRHSMVVIDAEKHKLDFKQSEIDNNISSLKAKWQTKYDPITGEVIGSGGASTIVSKAKGINYVEKRRGQPYVNMKGTEHYDPTRPEGALIYKTAYDNDLYYVKGNYDKVKRTQTYITTNGKKITYNMDDPADKEKYEPLRKLNPDTKKREIVYNKDPKTGEVYATNKDGSIKYRVKTKQDQSINMAETDDAYTLVSKKKHKMELLYADYANYMKTLANTARKEAIMSERLKKDSDAAKEYAAEVKSLDDKYNNAKKNSIRERTAIRLAAEDMKRKIAADPSLAKNSKEYKKTAQMLVNKYREQVNSASRKERAINITDKEWEAIQAGAISDTRLADILNNADADALRKRAMPKNKTGLNPAQINRIKALSTSNFTLAQIADQMGISPSLVSKYLNDKA